MPLDMAMRNIESMKGVAVTVMGEVTAAGGMIPDEGMPHAATRETGAGKVSDSRVSSRRIPTVSGLSMCKGAKKAFSCRVRRCAT